MPSVSRIHTQICQALDYFHAKNGKAKRNDLRHPLRFGSILEKARRVKCQFARGRAELISIVKKSAEKVLKLYQRPPTTKKEAPTSSPRRIFSLESVHRAAELWERSSFAPN